MGKEIERADSVDLNTINTRWGDKETVRSSRKTIIGFTQRLMTRLDDIESQLREPARQAKEQTMNLVVNRATETGTTDVKEKFHEEVSSTKDVSIESLAPPRKKVCKDPANSRDPR